MADNILTKDGNSVDVTLRSTDLGGGIQAPHHFVEPAAGIPHDWTEGTGVLPSGGSITIPANAARRLLLIQNQSAVTIPVSIGAVLANSSPTHAVMLLDPGAGVNKQGAADERNPSTYMFTGQIIVGATGLNGSQVLVIEG